MLEPLKADRWTYAGLFLITLATLMFEVLLTRIFSVTTWYHFAFFGVSMAMMGMTVGALVVYGRPKFYTPERTAEHLSSGAVWFAGMTLLAVLVHIYSPAVLVGADPLTLMVGALCLAIPFLVTAFAFSGICVSLALTRFPLQVSKLYAADLLGSALGCVLLVVSMQYLDGISEVFLVCFLAMVAALLFAGNSPVRRSRALIGCAAAAIVLLCSASSAAAGKPILKVSWSKGTRDDSSLRYERWNSFSRVRVYGDPDKLVSPMRHSGTSRNIPPEVTVRRLTLDIDGKAATDLLAFDGDFSKVRFLKYDIANLAHYLRPASDVLVIGMGGGRDVLSALAMDQKSVTAVEINPIIYDVTTRLYGDYTGHLDRQPKVHVVNDEARSYLARSKDKFDIIQASLIDTWAASTSGAFAMTENSLYTVECWRLFLDHLSDRGVVTMCRWWNTDHPAEFYRLTGLAAEALKQDGIADPMDHIAVVRLLPLPERRAIGVVDGIGTILVSKAPFSDADLDRLQRVCTDLGFELAFSKRGSADKILAEMAGGNGPADKSLPYNLSPPTDDSPFFFQTVNFAHLFQGQIYNMGGNSANAMAGVLLVLSLVVVVVLAALCFCILSVQEADKSVLRGSSSFLVYFFSIGFGFMLIEMSQMQRLSIYLGHPIYGLSVVLAVLLLATGLGSLILGNWASKSWFKPIYALTTLVVVLVAYALLAPLCIQTFSAAQTPERLMVAVALLFPVGLVLGLAFPLGMRLAAARFAALTPWLWGINGAASVIGSVAGVLLSLVFGISTTVWVAVAVYVAAALSLRFMEQASA